jgi:chromosome segregation ATPase
MADPARRRYDAPGARPRQRTLPRVTWVLAVSAFLCGALVSGAVFSVGWRHEAQRGTSAQAALAAATSRNHSLQASLAAAQTAARHATSQATAARKAQTSAAAAARAVSQKGASLATQLVAAGHAADSVSGGAASVGSNVDKLASELKTLTAYLTTTPTSQLDAGYVATQTQYLSKQLDQLGAARSDLDAAIADFQHTAKTLADRAGALR